jgi:hypothetical protein
MKLTVTKLLQLSMRGIGGETLQLYLTAYCWCMESGSWHIPCAVLANLPGAPRGKALGRAVADLIAAALIAADGDGYIVPERVTAAANRMRNWRANNQRNGDANSESNSDAAGNVTVEHHNGITAPSPPAPPLPDLSGSGSGFSDSSSALSSPSKPESKPARGATKPRKWGRFPSDWQVTEACRTLALELGVSADRELEKIRDHEFKTPRSDPEATFRTWLRRAAEMASERGQRGAVPPGLEQHNAHKQAAGAELARKLLLGGRRP